MKVIVLCLIFIFFGANFAVDKDKMGEERSKVEALLSKARIELNELKEETLCLKQKHSKESFELKNIENMLEILCVKYSEALFKVKDLENTLENMLANNYYGGKFNFNNCFYSFKNNVIEKNF